MDCTLHNERLQQKIYVFGVREALGSRKEQIVTIKKLLQSTNILKKGEYQSQNVRKVKIVFPFYVIYI